MNNFRTLRTDARINMTIAGHAAGDQFSSEKNSSWRLLLVSTHGKSMEKHQTISKVAGILVLVVMF